MKNILYSEGSEQVSISKLAMLVGLVICSGLVIYDTIVNKRVDISVFSVYTGITIGANSVNKAISVTKDINLERIEIEKEATSSTSNEPDNTTANNDITDTNTNKSS